jgi:threonine dehydratase
MQVPPEDEGKFQEFLDKLGYEYAEESKNPAYKLFLG